MGRRTPAWPSPLAYLVGNMATTRRQAMRVFNTLKLPARRLVYALGGRSELYAWAASRGGVIVYDGPATTSQRRRYGSSCWRLTLAVRTR